MVFVSCVLAGALRASLLSCGALWALGVPNWSATCSRRLLGLVCRPLRAAKRAAQLSRPSWVVFALPSVSGGSGTVEGLSSAVDDLWCVLGPLEYFSPFCYLRAPLTIFTTALAGGVVSAAEGSAVWRLNGGAKAAFELLRCLGYHDVAEFLGVLVV